METGMCRMDEPQGPTAERRELYSVACDTLSWKRTGKERICVTESLCVPQKGAHRNFSTIKFKNMARTAVRTRRWAKQRPSGRSHTGSRLRTSDRTGTRVGGPGCSDPSGVGQADQKQEGPGRLPRTSPAGTRRQSPSAATPHISACGHQAATEAVTRLLHGWGLGEGRPLSSLIVQLLSRV